ncbi:MAG: Tol-Pal system protein TolB [Pseudomonadota bacterium]|nr:Tol-Pal system protein TolB [Pseudomonadota bacterium]
MNGVRSKEFGRRVLVMAATLFFAVTARADLTIDINGGSVTQIPIAVSSFDNEAMSPQPVSRIIRDDLRRIGLFRLVDSTGVASSMSEASMPFDAWRAKGADAWAVGSITPEFGGQYGVSFRLMDVAKQSQIVGYQFSAPASQLREVAHRIADMIDVSMTGDGPAFNSRIAFVNYAAHRYTLQVADSDGFDAHTVLTSKEPIMSPSWSPHGGRLAYVTFLHGKAVIYIQSLVTGKRYRLGRFKGLSSAPVFSPDGHHLCIVLTSGEASRLYLINDDGSDLRPLTNTDSIDTEPDFSPDGTMIAFTSDRSGSPQIYTMPSSGGQPQRVSFQGRYYVSPRYSPDGKKIVCIRKQQGQLRVTQLNLKTGREQVMTQASLDESPSYAPNGKMILFANADSGPGRLVVLSSNGLARTVLKVKAGDIRDPAWGPILPNK